MKKKSLFLVFSLLLAGCATSFKSEKGVSFEKSVANNVAQQRETVAANIDRASKKGDPLPYVGSRLIKRKSQAEQLPEVFSDRITIGNGSRMSLMQIGQAITSLTRIPVNISPDLISASAKPSATTAPQQLNPMYPAAPQSVTVTAQQGSDFSLSPISIAFTGRLSEFLDHVASRLGIAWEYRNGTINFSRYITRIYMVNMYPGKSSQVASVGKTGSAAVGGGQGQGAGGSSGGGFSSSSTSDFSSELDPWATVEEAIKALKTKDGKYSISAATGMIVVTDTKDVQDRVSQYLKTLDRIMNLQITLKVSVISVDVDKNQQAGIDWNLVWNNLAAIAPNFSLSFRGVPNPSTLSTNGGGFGLAILTPTSGNAGKWDGSTAVFNALNSVSHATMVTDNVWHALNRQPLSVALADQTGFASTSTEQVTGNSNPISTVKVDMITTGFILNLVPSTVDGKEITLQFSLDISTPPVIENFGSVQIPRYSSKQIGQRAKLREGETLILSGFSLRDQSFSKSGLFSPDDPSIFGGNRNGKARDRDLVILITPIME